MAQYNNQPLGIFDSGIGGLTVAAAIKRALPDEEIIYFGDTAHLPYGDKSARTIRLYAERITGFLLDKGCKAIVIACNTASSVAYETLFEKYNGLCPVISVIEPTVKHLIEAGEYHRIGIIGTKATIRSGVYQKKILGLDPCRKVFNLATPLLVPMIEEGFFNNQISKTILENYLSNPLLSEIDCLVLACTHYPLIKKEIQAWYGNAVDVIDSAEWVAASLLESLKKRDLLARPGAKTNQFFVSDSTSSFRESARIFFGKDLELEQVSELL